ncbi:PIG-L family deacetylase [Streptomyces sp. Pv4-95]|uniref:PIG-L family deacetylase n=1 Tax=Streptomyces sp. Pv4-95 TaxID=3049543 RepID=UPI00389185A2
MQARPPRISRRRLLQATGGGVLAASAGAGVWAWLAPEDLLTRSAQGARTGRSVAAAPDPAFLHVIAHADDGLYFMNPDLEQSVRSGGRSVTVCLTGGESDGHNVGEETLDPASVPQDRAAFSRARVNGLRAAHAVMATGAPDSPWDIEAVSLLPGFQVEVQTLRAAPQNQLIFLGLVEARAVWAPRATSLRGLWLGASDTLPTLRAAGTPVQWPFHYTREQVVRTLVAVLERVGPSVVRTLDPNAVHEPHQPEDGPDFHLAGTDPRLTGLRYYDHQDHTASAYFVQAALARYWGRGHRRPTLVESYLGYEVAALPAGLDTAAARRKGDLLSVYGWADNRDCGDPAGCGDRKVGGSAFSGGSSGWTRSTRLRAPGSNGWIRPARDGRLVAFAVLDGRACCWTETDVGSGSFGGPVSVGGELLQGQIQVVRHPDGTLQLFACRTVLPGRNAAHRRELMTARQHGTAADGSPAFTRWESLGSPDPDPAKSLETGFPAAVAARNGTVHVFVRTWDGGIACRSGPHGTRWGLWQRLAGPVGSPTASPQVVDGLDACLDSKGLVHLVAPAPGTVHHWVSKKAGALPQPAAATGLPEAGGPVSVVGLGNGAVRMTYRRPDTAQVLIADWRRPAGGWRVTARCPVVGGHGRVAAAPVGRGDRMVLAVRDAAGEVRVAMAQEGPRPWQQGKVPHSGAAGVAVDAEGRAVVVALGHDGCLYAARQRAAGKSGRFVGWRAQAGSSDRAADGGAA